MAKVVTLTYSSVHMRTMFLRCLSQRRANTRTAEITPSKRFCMSFFALFIYLQLVVTYRVDLLRSRLRLVFLRLKKLRWMSGSCKRKGIHSMLRFRVIQVFRLAFFSQPSFGAGYQDGHCCIPCNIGDCTAHIQDTIRDHHECETL